MNNERDFFFRYRGAIMALVALIVLIVASPSVNSYLVGLLLGILGEAIRIWAIGWTGEHTRGQELHAPFLVTQGPYSVVRNPLYLGNVLNYCGVLLAAIGSLSAMGAIFLTLSSVSIIFVVYYSCITAEERFLQERFGEAFVVYKNSVPRLIPNWRNLITNKGGDFKWGRVKFEVTTIFWWVLIWSVLFYKLLMI